ncbi:MAG TPA: FtsQ-type POTRA domain-containing protein, partial [Longimicrobiales bacterium]|nr:FtsQ-type POTRA domain-containing protein [Longimicrobiales bacterium]
WALRSPFLSVEEVSISGAARSHPGAVLSSLGMGEGTPLISVDTVRLAAAMEEDPWVAEAEVSRDWPRRLVVSVTERAPVAWVETAGGWVHVAADGVVLETGSPGEGDPILAVPALAADALGEDPAATGALEFLDSLRDDLAGGASVAVVGEELQAQVGDVEVRLGRPVEMQQKARALAGVMDAGVEPGSVITLIAPTRPAVLAPGESTVTTTTTTAGTEG